MKKQGMTQANTLPRKHEAMRGWPHVDVRRER